MIIISLENIHLLTYIQNYRNRKKMCSLWWELLEFVLLTNFKDNRSGVNFIYHIVRYIPSIHLSKFVHFDNLHPVPLLPPPLVATFLWVCVFAWSWSIIDLPRYVSSCYTTSLFAISILFKMITVTLVTICHHAKISHNLWLYSLHCTFHTCDSFTL